MKKTPCPRCGGSKLDPENVGACWECCFEKPPPPELPQALHAESGRPALFHVQLDWVRAAGNARAEGEIMRTMALWNRPQEEWELERPVLLRGAYRTQAESSIETSWLIHYAGRRTGEFFDPTGHGVVDGAMRLVGDGRRSASEQALTYTRAVREWHALAPYLRTPTQIAYRVAMWMEHPNKAFFAVQAHAEREALVRRAAQLRTPFDPMRGFTFQGRSR